SPPDPGGHDGEGAGPGGAVAGRGGGVPVSASERIGGSVGRFRRREPPVPEGCLVLRGVALAAVMVAIGAVVAQGAVDPSTAVGALLLAPVGFAFSWIRRRRRNFLIKVGLAAAMLVALLSFLGQVKQ